MGTSLEHPRLPPHWEALSLAPVLLMRKAWPVLCFPHEPLHFCLFAKSQLRAWVSTLGVMTLQEAEQTGASQAALSPIPTAPALLQHASCSASWQSPGLQALCSGLISILCSHTSTSHCGGVLTKSRLFCCSETSLSPAVLSLFDC